MNDKTLSAIRESIAISVGAVIKAQREKMGFSLQDLALMVGTIPGTLEQVEAGRAYAAMADLYLLAAALGLHLIDLLPTVSTADRQLVEVYRRVREAEAIRETALKEIGRAALMGLEYVSAAMAHAFSVPVRWRDEEALVIKEGATYRIKMDSRQSVETRHDAVLQVWHAPQDDTMPLSELTVDADAFLLDGKFWKLVKHDPMKGSQIRPAQGTGKWEWVDSSSLVTLATFGKD